MDPAPTARTCPCSARQGNYFLFSSPLQEGHIGPGSCFCGAIFLVNFEPHHRDALRSRHRSLKFFDVDLKLLQTVTDDELRLLDVVFFDVTTIRNDIWIPLRRVCRIQKYDGLPLLVGAWSREYHPWSIHGIIEKAPGPRITYAKDPQAVFHVIALMKHERRELSQCGPLLMITHRAWQRGTICTPGEVIYKVELVYRGKRFLVRLSTALLLLLDYLSRHRYTPQSLSQIAAGVALDPFCQEHGAHAGAQKVLAKELSRPAVKQQLLRLRGALQDAFDDAGLSLDAKRVLISEETDGSEVLYRLKAGIDYEHVQF